VDWWIGGLMDWWYISGKKGKAKMTREIMIIMIKHHCNLWTIRSPIRGEKRDRSANTEKETIVHNTNGKLSFSS